MKKSVYALTLRKIAALILFISVSLFALSAEGVLSYSGEIALYEGNSSTTTPSDRGFDLSRLTFTGNGDFFKLDPLKDSVIGGAGLAMSVTGLTLNKFLHLKDETWRGDLPDKNEVPALDRFFMQPYSKGLDITGDILQFTALLSPALLMLTPMEEWLSIGVMYAEAVLFSYGAKELTKAFVNRTRPYMYFDNRPEELVSEGDWNDSFMSGHSTLAFTGASFLSYVFSKYFSDSPWKYVVTAASFTVAASTAFTRVAGGNHFLTDVLTGAAVGTLSGFLLPWLHSIGFSSGAEKNKGSSAVTKSVEPLLYLDRLAVRFSF
ncbi:MAG: phosphatase PAP2 family protein [Treponemataceae bacterium]|nr:phosphatase PAP2 family protein [Treponemataceae bacterium]